MPLRNRDGAPIDPVPFAVVVGLAFMLIVSLGPLYGQAYGLPLWVGLLVSGCVFLVVAALAYHWTVRTARAADVDVPAALQAEQLLYVALILGLVICGLTVPLVL